MNAPFCPISKNQPPGLPRGTAPARLPAIPTATDLPSLIRAVNIMRDILRTLTTSLTVNNTFYASQPRAPKVYGELTYTFSPYPDWYQAGGDTSIGYVYYKTKKAGQSVKDEDQRAYVDRINAVHFRNNERDNDNLFRWLYSIPLDADYRERESNGAELFEEDFFERVVNVHWGDGLAVEFGAGAKAAPRADEKPKAEPVPEEPELVVA